MEDRARAGAVDGRTRRLRHRWLTTMTMELGLYGKVAVVTGASKGIGLAVTAPWPKRVPP